MPSRPIFTASDIDQWVLTKPQGSLLKDINFCKYKLATLPLDDLGCYYWTDRLDALELAVYIAQCGDYPLSGQDDTINELRQQILMLETKLLALITPRKVKGGISV